jgi:hypothetical protein
MLGVSILIKLLFSDVWGTRRYETGTVPGQSGEEMRDKLLKC